MSADRLFFKLHNGFPEHPKAFELSDKAFRQLIEAWCYCSRNLNDGKLTKAQFFKLFSAKSRKELLTVGFVEATDFGYEMHDYLEHQQSAEDVETLRNKRAAAGAKGGKAKARGVASAKQEPQQTPSKSVADTDTDTDTELKEEKTCPTPSDDDDPKPLTYPPSFEAFWADYPRKGGKKAAYAAFQKARKTATVQQICSGAARYAADPNRDDAYTALPATWLNRGSWDDDPLPDRNASAAASRPSGSQTRAQAGLARLAAYDQTGQTQYTPQLELGA